MHVVIAGGGIAGLATAIAVRRAGHGATVLERRSAAEEPGSWLQVASNGMVALDALGLGDAASALGEATPRVRISAADGRRTADLPLGPQPGEGRVTRSLRRAELHALLREEAARVGARTVHAARVTSVAQDARGATLSTEYGERHAGDLVIGADGVGSAVREGLGARGPRPADRLPGLVYVGGTARAGALPASASAPGTLQFRFGRDCFLAYALLEDGTIGWFANPRVPVSRRGSAPDAPLASEDWARLLLRLGARDALPLEHLVPASPDLDARLPRPEAPPAWGARRVVLVGDAAHAISPSSGQGASLALEDAAVLGRILDGGADPADVAAQLARRRRQRVAYVIEQGRWLDRIKLLGPVCAAFRDRVMMPLADRRSAGGGAAAGAELYDFVLG
ncbi:3-hydroxybenzoate 6-hydroxylase 1 [Clavibacter michiganensis]|uniref:3-hydroxybenzoate 6-hydroxylase 1 n=1 Tax=Clavibacter michiganensis TaxID=28447 RepID=A0A251Y5R8_9MICO|nr:NAD(P)/FAD-dependent oxidoreductase [Clavibacter michiganensis]OUE19647.1 3-hydroxybenzoate 6-hydroxylase 1 [Clavibacter michiganensis]